MAAYEFLAKIFFYSDKKEDVFAHLFLVLDWYVFLLLEKVLKNIILTIFVFYLPGA